MSAGARGGLAALVAGLAVVAVLVSLMARMATAPEDDAVAGDIALRVVTGIEPAGAPLTTPSVADVTPLTPRAAAALGPPSRTGGSDFGAVATIRGCVRFGGLAAPGVSVEVRQSGGSGLMTLIPWEPIVSDARGDFEALFDAGATVELRASDGLLESPWVAVQTVGAASHEVVLELVDAPWVRGVVVDADGEPAAGVDVTARRLSPADAADGADAAFGWTDRDGAFQLRLPRDGTWSLSARAQGSASTPVEVDLSGSRVPEVLLRLEPVRAATRPRR